MKNNSMAVVETAAVSTSTNQALHQLFSAIWRDTNRVHQVGVLNRHGGGFTNLPISEGSDPVASVLPFLSFSLDVYFAVAEYKSTNSRTASNAVGAWALWLDIDVGPEMASAGKGYTTQEEAKARLKEFCAGIAIPEPTHLVESGSGLHAYWALTTFLNCQAWQQIAQQFKRLTQTMGFRSDPSRTADIASVLRIPGTLNYKYNPPKPVTLIAATDSFIETETMVAAIQDAYEQDCGFDQTSESTPAGAASFTGGDTYLEPPNIAQLTSALKILDPDCEEYIWVFHRIAPMANTSAEIPEIADWLYGLAKEWSSGALRGVPSKKWHTPGGNGLTGAQYFDRVWNRFLKGKCRCAFKNTQGCALNFTQGL